MHENEELISNLTSIRSLFAPSVAADASAGSGLNSFKALVKYSPAGVVFIFSALGFARDIFPATASAPEDESKLSDVILSSKEPCALIAGLL
jgi:hypothetical protein